MNFKELIEIIPPETDLFIVTQSTFPGLPTSYQKVNSTYFKENPEYTKILNNDFSVRSIEPRIDENNEAVLLVLVKDNGDLNEILRQGFKICEKREQF